MLAPFFTVVIATHKRPVLLRRAITSILNQTYQNFKIIIISDSKDFDTYSTASELLRISDVFIQREGIPGPSESRNLGIQCATGTHVIFLDDDDAFDNTFFSDLVNSSKFTVLDKLFYVNCKVIDLGLTKSTTLINTSTPDKGTLFVKNFLPNNCIIYPISIVRKIYFDLNIAYEDWDFLLSAIKICELYHINIYGPIIYKNSDFNDIPRGSSNTSDLLNCYLKIYLKHPPPTQNITELRKELFKSMNLDLDLLLKNYAVSNEK